MIVTIDLDIRAFILFALILNRHAIYKWLKVRWYRVCIEYKYFKRRRQQKRDYGLKKGRPTRCPCCGASNLQVGSSTSDSVVGLTEFEIECSDCGEVIASWKYNRGWSYDDTKTS